MNLCWCELFLYTTDLWFLRPVGFFYDCDFKLIKQMYVNTFLKLNGTNCIQFNKNRLYEIRRILARLDYQQGTVDSGLKAPGSLW